MGLFLSKLQRLINRNYYFQRTDNFYFKTITTKTDDIEYAIETTFNDEVVFVNINTKIKPFDKQLNKDAMLIDDDNDKFTLNVNEVQEHKWFVFEKEQFQNEVIKPISQFIVQQIDLFTTNPHIKQALIDWSWKNIDIWLDEQYDYHLFTKLSTSSLDDYLINNLKSNIKLKTLLSSLKPQQICFDYFSQIQSIMIVELKNKPYLLDEEYDVKTQKNIAKYPQFKYLFEMFCDLKINSISELQRFFDLKDMLNKTLQTMFDEQPNVNKTKNLKTKQKDKQEEETKIVIVETDFLDVPLVDENNQLKIVEGGEKNV